MRRRDFLVLPLLSSFAGTAARAAPAPPVNVVASFSILADLVAKVAGPAARVSALVGPDGDAHVYEPSPADARRVREAALVVVNGLGFEGWMPRLIRASGYRGPVVTATEGIAARPGGRHPDPHAWQDPALVKAYVNNVLAGLTRAVPALAATFRASAAAFVDELDALDADLRARFARVPASRRRVITTHDAFAYFGAAYGVEFLTLQGWTTENEPSAADVARLVRVARTGGASAAFVENIADPRLVRTLAADTGLRFGGRLYSDALAPPGHPASTYLGMMRHNAETLLAALVDRVQPARSDADAPAAAVPPSTAAQENPG
ncbi:MAG: zinc ABC transporter substrate-binding protein [Steroidobacteraceae bacterium]|jgi:zinc/manganese transport system substrate-binding protein|nr:zinc ABC transporter substrate-binding protein [Steroidobacteraceae bacterium]